MLRMLRTRLTAIVAIVALSVMLSSITISLKMQFTIGVLFSHIILPVKEALAKLCMMRAETLVNRNS